MNFRDDPRIQEGKRLILEAVKEHSQKLTKIKAPQEEKIISYQQLITALTDARGAPLFYPYIGSGLGNGALVELLDGAGERHVIGDAHPASGQGRDDPHHRGADRARPERRPGA